MYRNRIIAFIACALALIGLAAVPAIQSAWPAQAAVAPAKPASASMPRFGGPVHTWSAYQPIDALPPAMSAASPAPAKPARALAPRFGGPMHTWSAYQPIEGMQ